MRHMRSKFTPYTCITVDMLFNIVGHKIDGNCESWNCLMQKLAPSRGQSFPHPGGNKGDVKIMHILFSYFIRSHKAVNTLINNIFFCNMVLLGSANPSYPKWLSLLEGPPCSRLPHDSKIANIMKQDQMTRPTLIKIK